MTLDGGGVVQGVGVVAFDPGQGGEGGVVQGGGVVTFDPRWGGVRCCPGEGVVTFDPGQGEGGVVHSSPPKFDRQMPVKT